MSLKHIAFILFVIPIIASASPFEMPEYASDTDSSLQYSQNTVVTTTTTIHSLPHRKKPYTPSFKSRLPQHMSSGEPTIIIDPIRHVWGAYSSSGKLLRAGLVTAGSKWCADLGRTCKTKAGVFRIKSLGGQACVSKRFPLGEGGAPMPYCMYFNGGQAIHGSYEVRAANLSHGCVRVSVSDAYWLRFKFARVGTKVIVKNY